MEQQEFVCNWSEPHINGTAVRELYNIYIIMVCGSHKTYAQHAWFYGHKHEIFYYACSQLDILCCSKLQIGTHALKSKIMEERARQSSSSITVSTRSG